MTDTKSLQERLRVKYLLVSPMGPDELTILAEREEAADALDAQAKLIAEAREVLEAAENDFERVRQILVHHLEEPERRAFWAAVRGRDRAASLLTKLEQS